MAKIALVANTTWNIYNFRLNVIRRLRAEGHEVIVMAPVDEYISYQWKIQGVHHYPIRTLRRDSVNPLRDIQLTLELIRLYRTHRPDLVVHYTVKPNIYGGIAAKLAGIPSIAVVTGLGYAFIHNGLVKRTTKSLYKVATRFHKRIVFENQDDRSLFIEEKLLDPAKSMSVKGCGVDLEFYSPADNTNGANKPLTFAFIGRLLYDKGIQEFIQAARLVKAEKPEVRFLIVGEIDRDNPSAIRETDLLRWVKDHIVEYHGATHDIRPFIAQSDCIILPSYREGMPRILMEAMAMKRPIITTDTAGCRETVEDAHNGFIVPVGNTEALAQAMRRFSEMSAMERELFGANGRNMAEELFDEHKIADEMYRIIGQVLSNR